MKHSYSSPSLTILDLTRHDLICTSDPSGSGTDVDGGDGWARRRNTTAVGNSSDDED